MKNKIVIRENGFLKKAAAFLLVLLILVSFVGIDPQEVSAAKAKNRIEFEKSKTTLYAGEYTTVIPTEVYQNGKLMAWATPGKPLDKKEFTFKSSDTKVAKVNSKGVVTAKKKGTANITVTSIYNKKVKGTFRLTVSKGTQKAKITLQKTKATIAVGKSTTISVKATKGLSAKTVKYSSSNTKVAAVNSKGKVVGKKAGTATITVTSGVNKKVTAKFKVTVKTPDVIDTDYSPKGKAKIVLEETRVTLAPAKSFTGWYSEHGGPWNDTKELAAMSGLGDGITPAKIMAANQKKYGTAQIKIKKMTGLKSMAVMYKSSNTKVAAVDSMGKITPKKAGTAVITVTAKADRKVKATYKVTVRNLVTSFEFNQYTNLKKQEPWKYGETAYIDDMYDWREVYAYPMPETADNRGYTLTSSDESIVRVYSGQVAGVGYGTATLTLKSADGFCRYSWKCTVSDKGTTCWGNVDFGD